MSTETDVVAGRGDSLAFWALGTAGFALAAVIVAYWMIVPSIVLGLVAVILGVIARRRSDRGDRSRELATVAICLGAVAMAFTPIVLVHTSAAEDWGRDCALEPEHDENC